MKISFYYFPLFSIALALVSLYILNSSINHDLKDINEEVKMVGQTLTKAESNLFASLTNLSKKRTSYDIHIDDYLAIKNKVHLVQNTHEIIHKEVLKLDLYNVLNENTPYLSEALNSSFPELSKNYMQLALMEILQDKIDKLSFQKEIRYSPIIITINEPISYHIGESYMLDFKVINSIDSSNDERFSICTNEDHFHPSDFPLVFNKPHLQKEYTLISNHPNSNFHTRRLQIVNNCIVKTNKI